MIQAYHFKNGPMKNIDVTDLKEHVEETIWLELFNPTIEEETFIEGLLGINIPTRDEMQKIDLSSRLYKINNTTFATINLVNVDTRVSKSHAVTFVLHNKWLITVHYMKESFFNRFIDKMQKDNMIFNNGSAIFISLLDEITESISDILENTIKSIEEINNQIFKFNYSTNGSSKAHKPNFKNIISHIGRNEDILSKAQESLFTITRMLSFMLQTPYFKTDEDIQKFTIIMRDISSLIEHGTFLSDKINFLLEATLGMINIEQSSIIKIVSVAAVVFLPPTLVASIYGMNFEYMPELKWSFGYPLALFLMIVSGFLPYKYFKYKGWL